MSSVCPCLLSVCLSISSVCLSMSSVCLSVHVFCLSAQVFCMSVSVFCLSVCLCLLSVCLSMSSVCRFRPMYSVCCQQQHVPALYLSSGTENDIDKFLSISACGCFLLLLLRLPATAVRDHDSSEMFCAYATQNDKNRKKSGGRRRGTK